MLRFGCSSRNRYFPLSTRQTFGPSRILEALHNKMAGRYSRLLLLAKLLVDGTVPVLGQNTSTDFLQYVDPLIGTTNGGHVFPGATLPFGMAKAAADVGSSERQGGYASDDGDSKKSTCRCERGTWANNSYAVTGFSHMHDSGTGGVGGLKETFRVIEDTRLTNLSASFRGKGKATFQYSPRQAALTTIYTNASFRRHCEHPNVSMTRCKPAQATLPSR